MPTRGSGSRGQKKTSTAKSLPASRRTRKPALSEAQQRVLARKQTLTRRKALKAVADLLQDPAGINGEAFAMITLFHLQPEELTEAGVSFEIVCALEKKHPLLFGDPL